MASNNGTPSRKRPAGGPQNSSRANKRQRTEELHHILTQPSDKAVGSNGELDVGSFIKAREFEIRALENNMAVSKKGSSTRAFQQVPRDLRRRTASHNVKRTPKRLRTRAAKEMREDNTPTVVASKRQKTSKKYLRAQNAKKIPELAARIEKQKEKEDKKLAASIKKRSENALAVPKVTVLKHKRRQITKQWLPTHVWHAKRATMTPPMEPLWRFSIPLTPTEKTARITGRASRLRGCVAWDASYTSTISISGAETGLLQMLRLLSMPEQWLTGSLGILWRAGHRSQASWLTEGANKLRFIAKVILIWQPEQEVVKERQLFLRVQPAGFLQVWEELLKIAKSQTPIPKVEDLRFAIGSINITGPASLEVLTGVLSANAASEEEQPSLWRKIACIQDSYSIHRGAMVHLMASDPRLGQPHQTVREKFLSPPDGSIEVSSEWLRGRQSATAPIFDALVRHKAVRSLQSQSAINKRKGAALPGHKPEPLPNDPRIPILLLANNHEEKGQALGSWTILMPWDCVLPTWHSLMHYPLADGGNPRFGGLNEEHQLSFENNRPWFPCDFPGTKSGWQWELDQRAKRKSTWDRKPRSRRVEWSTLDLGNGTKGEIGLGWACDWQYLAELDSGKANGVTPSDSKDLPSGICQIVGPALEAAESFPQHGLTTVSLTMVNRGTVSACARIYLLPSDPASKAAWLEQHNRKDGVKRPAATSSAIPETQLDSDETSEPEQPNHPSFPPAADLVGFVTTGNFNLAKGKGTGIGCIQWTKVVNEAKSRKDGVLHGLCIVRDAGQTVGRLAVWETVS